MSGFSPEWLALREPVDHRSRDAGIAHQLREHFAGWSAIRVVDLGCGTGSNLRGTFHLLPADQSWTLVDYDRRLLEAARETISAWADSREYGDGADLVVMKDGKRLRLRFRQADLNTGLDEALGTAPDLVTASAFFDLCSAEFIGRLAAAVAARRAVFFTVLTYNGQQDWSPRHPADARMLTAFIGHQVGDKGFGPSVGPAAAPALGATFQSAGYVVHEGDSPWRLDQGDQRLIADLASGFAEAVAETRAMDADTLASWSEVVRLGAVVGHTDTLAVPGVA